MRKVIFVTALLLISFLAYLAVYSLIFSDEKLHIVFCDVGQGDGILIRTPSGIVSLYDGGPDDSIETCLAKHLPFWQRTIALLLLSHPHADHYIGMLGVLDHYRVKSFATEDLVNETVLFSALLDRLKAKEISTRHLYTGDLFRFKDGVTIEVLGPTKEYLAQTSPHGVVGEKAEFASLILLITYGKFSALLTGDSQATGIERAMKRLKISSIDVLHVPHHGSKTGLNEAVLDRLKPKLAVISVGKNSYGHPSPEIVKILGDHDIKILRTIEEGDVEVVSDGKSFMLKNN